MSIKKAKDVKSSLSKAWTEAPDNGANIVEGTYQFKIDSAKYKESDKSIGVRSTLKVIGGNDDYIGETIQQFDNLATQQNMSFFKQKLMRLGINIPSDFSDIEDGTIPSEMEGKTFEGTVKIKDGFVNIYVNKLVDADEEDADEAAGGTDNEDAEEVEEETEEGTEEDEDEDVEEETEEETEEDDVEEDEEEEDGFPEPEEITTMNLQKVNKQLKGLGIDITKIKNNKLILETISKYLYIDGYKPEPIAVKSTMEAFGIKMTKDPITNRKTLRIHIKKLIEA